VTAGKANELEDDDDDENMTYLPFCNANQRMHCDYPNHSLVMPPSWHSPEVVSIIVYYDESEDTGGQTAVVPREGERDPVRTHILITLTGDYQDLILIYIHCLCIL
jgi:hypothetical protein